MTPSRIIVMGVAGSGKSTVAFELAARFEARLLEADEFHPGSNLAKMASGIPLTDEDRWPWLAAVREAMLAEDRVVVACSALKRSYRDALRSACDVCFVYLVVTRDEIIRRVTSRVGHFMGVIMVDSQFHALQPPGDEENDVVWIDAGGPVDSVIDQVAAALASL
jgi:gluconokinase